MEESIKANQLFKQLDLLIHIDRQLALHKDSFTTSELELLGGLQPVNSDIQVEIKTKQIIESVSNLNKKHPYSNSFTKAKVAVIP